MARTNEGLELIGDWSIERAGSEVSIESVLLPNGAHRSVIEEFPQMTYERRTLARVALGPLAVDKPGRTRFIAVQDVAEQWVSDVQGYDGNALLNHKQDVYRQQTEHTATVRRTRAVIGFRLSALRSIPSSILHGDKHAVLTDLAVKNEGDTYEQQQYAAIAVLSAFRYLTNRRTETTVSAGPRLELNHRDLWESLHPETAGLPLHPDRSSLRHPIIQDAKVAYAGFRQYLINAKLLGA